MKKQKNIRTDAGQTLLEILFAFGISIMVLSAIIFGITTSLSNAQYTKDQSLATFYATEGMSIIRQMRDNSWSGYSQKITDLTNGDKYCITSDSALPLQQISSADNCVGNYSVGNGFFSREVVFELPSSSCNGGSKATVKVSWTDNKCTSTSTPFCHHVELVSCFSEVDPKSTP